MTTWDTMTRAQKDQHMREIMGDGERAAARGETIASQDKFPKHSAEAVWWRRGWGNWHLAQSLKAQGAPHVFPVIDAKAGS